jgi:hypothetical protein
VRCRGSQAPFDGLAGPLFHLLLSDMKRTLIALVAAGFAFAAGSSFAQAPAAAPAKSAKHHSSHKASHAKKSTGTPVAKKKSKTPAAA